MIARGAAPAADRMIQVWMPETNEKVGKGERGASEGGVTIGPIVPGNEQS